MTEKRNSTLECTLGNAQNLNDLIDYAADSIVSKTLLDRNVGTITLFAFAQGQRLSEHTAPYHAVVEIVDGTGVFTIGDKNIEAASGQILIMPAGVPHRVYAAQKFKMLLTMIRE